jgi:hypothetical protein
MTKHQILACLAVAMTTMGADAAQTQGTEDHVVASFLRELNHEPMRRAPVTRAGIYEDVLYEQINARVYKKSIKRIMPEEEVGE